MILSLVKDPQNLTVLIWPAPTMSLWVTQGVFRCYLIPTFISLHSLESEKAGNISSYFCTASWVTRGWILEQRPVSQLLYVYTSSGPTHLCIQHVYTEVTQRCLEEVILGTVFQERTVHCMGSDLEITNDSSGLFYHYSHRWHWCHCGNGGRIISPARRSQ